MTGARPTRPPALQLPPKLAQAGGASALSAARGLGQPETRASARKPAAKVGGRRRSPPGHGLLTTAGPGRRQGPDPRLTPGPRPRTGPDSRPGPHLHLWTPPLAPPVTTHSPRACPRASPREARPGSGVGTV